MSSTQHQLIKQCATRLRGIVEALDNIHDTSPHRWSTDLDDVHSSAESLLALIKDQAPTQAAQGLAGAALAQPSPALPPFAEKVLAKLRRFYDCASDFESGGVDIGRHWLDLLTQLGLLNRVQRSPALWEISQQGEDLLGASQDEQVKQAESSNTPGYDQLWGWFGLSRSAYAVLPRVMMHAMPDDWQARFAELMDEWDEHWPNQPDITAHVQIKQNNRFISTPPWLLNYRHPDHNQLNAMRGKGEL
ncbi:hypothetical protein [Pseudomonas aeruginosa]|uniref:hypothetical protein n=1 Tax=Pseudomonas aeruginosa TaxID=287 RepID=UPI0039C45779